MKKMLFVVMILLVVFLLGLNFAPIGEHHEQEHELHLLEHIRQHTTPLTYDLSATQPLDTTGFIAVHSNVPGVANFLTERRISTISSFPCSNCHDQPLAKMKTQVAPNLQKAHWDIQLAHASQSTMNCTTCHAEDDMNQLTTLTGEILLLDESFKLCGQCHSTQLKDWQGGAHGKSINGWKPPRAAKTCVSCHNPHKPAFPKRFPARLNTQELGE